MSGIRSCGRIIIEEIMLKMSQASRFFNRKIALALLATLPLIAVAAPNVSVTPISVFVSTDVGCEIDDQWVLLHLLTDPHFKVLAIATAQAPVADVPAPSAETTAATARQVVERIQPVPRPIVVSGSNEAMIDAKTLRPSRAVDALLQASRPFNSQQRLTVLLTGAATDVASALLKDPTLADRISIVAMGFRNYTSGDEYNIKNDPFAWRVILNSRTPLAVGDGDSVLKSLSFTREEAIAFTQDLGTTGAWLMADYDAWYVKVTKNYMNAGRPDAPHSWPIWDEVVVAYLLGMTKSEVRPRPMLTDDMKLVPQKSGTVVWITEVQRDPVFASLKQNLAAHIKGKKLPEQNCVLIAREPNACWRQQGR